MVHSSEQTPGRIIQAQCQSFNGLANALRTYRSAAPLTHKTVCRLTFAAGNVEETGRVAVCVPVACQPQAA
jgi:hypothetical protein